MCSLLRACKCGEDSGENKVTLPLPLSLLWIKMRFNEKLISSRAHRGTGRETHKIWICWVRGRRNKTESHSLSPTTTSEHFSFLFLHFIHRVMQCTRVRRLHSPRCVRRERASCSWRDRCSLQIPIHPYWGRECGQDISLIAVRCEWRERERVYEDGRIHWTVISAQCIQRDGISLFSNIRESCVHWKKGYVERWTGRQNSLIHLLLTFSMTMVSLMKRMTRTMKRLHCAYGGHFVIHLFPLSLSIDCIYRHQLIVSRKQRERERERLEMTMPLITRREYQWRITHIPSLSLPHSVDSLAALEWYQSHLSRPLCRLRPSLTRLSGARLVDVRTRWSKWLVSRTCYSGKIRLIKKVFSHVKCYISWKRKTSLNIPAPLPPPHSFIHWPIEQW